MSDLISRSELLQEFEIETYIHRGGELWHITGIKAMIENAPAVEVVPVVDRWIPCSERLPNSIGVYRVTKEFLSGDRVIDCAYFDGQDTWHNDNRVNHARGYLKNVIAWMPLPEPYTG